MNVTIKYMAQIKVTAGVAEETLDLADPCSVSDLLRQLTEKHHPGLRPMLLDESGRLQPTILLFVNDSQVQDTDAAMLANGDVVTFLSPIAGG